MGYDFLYSHTTNEFFEFFLHSLKSFAEINPMPVAAALLQTLKTGNNLAKSNAAQILGEIGYATKEILNELIILSNYNDENVSEAARESLEKLQLIPLASENNNEKSKEKEIKHASSFSSINSALSKKDTKNHKTSEKNIITTTNDPDAFPSMNNPIIKFAPNNGNDANEDKLLQHQPSTAQYHYIE